MKTKRLFVYSLMMLSLFTAFAGMENNPPYCPPHIWKSFTKDHNCTISLTAPGEQIVPIGSAISMSAGEKGDPGHEDTDEVCEKCGLIHSEDENDDYAASTANHTVTYSWSVSGCKSTASGNDLTATFTPTEAGTGSVTFTVSCGIDGTLSQVSSSFTVVEVNGLSITPNRIPIGDPDPVVTVSTNPSGHSNMVSVSPQDISTSLAGQYTANATCGTSSAQSYFQIVEVASVCDAQEFPVVLEATGDNLQEVILSATSNPAGNEDMIQWAGTGADDQIGGSITVSLPCNKPASYQYTAAIGESSKTTTVTFVPYDFSFSSQSKYQGIDIHGLPIPEKKPQQEEEIDQPISRLKVNASSLTPSYSVTDISIPIANSDLKLEFRRSTGLKSKTLGFAGVEYTHPEVMGICWDTNVLARALSCGSFICIFDEDGAEYKYDNGKPVINNCDDAACAQTKLEKVGDTIIWTKKYGTVYTFSNKVWESPDDNVFMYYLTSITDRNGNTIRYLYNEGSQFPNKIYYDDGSPDPEIAISINYTDNKISSVTDPMGREYLYTYDENGELESVSAPEVTVYNDSNPEGTAARPVTHYTSQTIDVVAGSSVTKAIKSITDPEGNTISFAYSQIPDPKYHYLSSITSPDGVASFSFQMKTPGQVITQVTDTRGNQWKYNFHNLNTDAGCLFLLDIDRTLIPADTAQPQETAQWKFEVGSGFAVNLARIIDARGNSIEYKYDGEGYDYEKWNDVYQEITYPGGGADPVVKTFGYDDTFHVMKRIVSPRGFETTYVLDAKGNRLEEHAPENKTMYFEYDSRGIQTKAADADGRVTESSRVYNASGWTDTTTVKGYSDELNIVSAKVYDLCGNLISETDGNGNTTTYQYDALNSLIKVTKPAVYDTETSTTVNPVIEYRRNANSQKVAEKNERGKWTRCKYDSLYRLTEKQIEMPGDDITTHFTYDNAGNKTAMTDPMGMVTAYSYDAANRLISESVTNPSGGAALTKTYEYGTNCGNDIFGDTGYLPTKITDRKGVAEEYVYDGAYRLISRKRDNILLSENVYDASGNVVQQTNYNTTGNQVTAFVYDQLDRETSRTIDPSGLSITTQTEYDKSGNVTAVIDPESKRSETEYDGAGRDIKQSIKMSAGGDIITNIAYDNNSNKLSETLVNDSGNGNQTTQWAYDALNRVSSMIDPEGFSESYKYDLAGNQTIIIDKLSNQTDREYDDANRPVKTTLPQVFDAESGQNIRTWTSQSYDLNSNITRTVDPRGLITDNVYDSLNRLTKNTKDAGGIINVVTEFTYDANNNKESETLRRGDFDLVTEYTYDNFNRLTSVKDPENFSETYAYDTVGNKLSTTDKRGASTHFNYDCANRLVKTILPEVTCYETGDGTGTLTHPETVTSYLKNGWVASITDAMNNTTTNEYDDAGRKTKVTNAEGASTLYSYDKAGNILTQIVENGTFTGDQTTEYTYDKRNLLLTEKLMPGTGLERVYTYSYDAAGQKNSRRLPDLTVTAYQYDALNRLTAETYTGASGEDRTYTYNLNGAVIEAVDISGKTVYAYDKLGRISSEEKQSAGGATLSLVTHQYDKAGNRVSVAYPGGKTLAFTYDKRNLLSTVIDGTDETVYSYDANGNRTGLSLPNGVVTTTSFDAANRVTQLENIKDSVGIYTTEYFMDKVGNRLKITENRPSGTRNLIYTYDSVYRLLSESDDITGTAIVTSYTFDDAGNRISKSSTGVPPVNITYTVDQLNRVLSMTDGVDTTTYTYDLNGNRTQKNINSGSTVHNYVYDRENRLASVNDGTNDIFSAEYDYRTRRMSKTENGTTVLFNFDGGINVQELDDSRTITKQLVRGTGMGGGIGSVLYTEDSSASNREFFCYNAIGSTVALTDSVGTVTSTSDYEAFGKVVRTTGSTSENRLFCTKEKDSSINLVDFGMRYYDEDLGRFITRDPAGQVDGPNVYVYCHSNPINFIDPLGLKGKPDDAEWHHIIGKDRETKKLFERRGWTEKQFEEFRNKHGVISSVKDHRLKGDSIHSKKWNKDLVDKLGKLKGEAFNEKNILKAVDELKGSKEFSKVFEKTFDAGDINYGMWNSKTFRKAGGRDVAKNLLQSVGEAAEEGGSKLSRLRGMATKSLKYMGAVGMAGVGVSAFEALGTEDVHREYAAAYKAFQAGNVETGWEHLRQMGIESSLASGEIAPFYATSGAEFWMRQDKNYGFTQMARDIEAAKPDKYRGFTGFFRQAYDAFTDPMGRKTENNQ